MASLTPSSTATCDRTRVVKEITDFLSCSRVPEVPADITPLEFYRQFVAASCPCIIRAGHSGAGIFDHWRARQYWLDDSYLLDTCKDLTVTVNYTPDGHGDCVRNGLFVKPEERQVSFPEVWRQLTKYEGNDDCDVGVPYCSIQNDCLRQEFQPLANDIDVTGIALANEALRAELEAVNIWVGDERSVSSVHSDPFENFYCVIRGSKKVCLLPPTDAPYLGEGQFRAATYYQPNPGDTFEVKLDDDGSTVPWYEVDPLYPDLNKNPEFANASPVTVDVHAGDLLYIPSLWLHRVSHNRCIGPSIAVNFWYAMRFGPSYVATMLRRELAGMDAK